jgi:hypothetical protein
MKNEKNAPKKVNVAAVVEALKVQSKLRAGLITGGGGGGKFCLTCGQNSVLQS